MKKNSIIFCMAIAAFGVQAFGFMKKNESDTDQAAIAASEANAINQPVKGKMTTSILSDFVQVVGPCLSETGHCPPYLSGEPVKQATYEGGMKALMAYLMENSKEARAGQEMDKLQPFKLVFTVTKNGSVANVKLEGTSGYYAIDYRMIDLILKAPGKWEPAENAKGEKVDQEQEVTLGPTGC